MKRLSEMFAIIILILCFISACSDESYENGYADGYDDAKSEMQHITEEECLDWYDIGYDDGYWDGSREGWFEHLEEPGSYLEEEAVHYARKYSDWHPEEAMAIIYSYQTKEPLYDDCILPSYEEYLDAIESLYRFYEYFYCNMYD